MFKFISDTINNTVSWAITKCNNLFNSYIDARNPNLSDLKRGALPEIIVGGVMLGATYLPVMSKYRYTSLAKSISKFIFAASTISQFVRSSVAKRENIMREEFLERERRSNLFIHTQRQEIVNLETEAKSNAGIVTNLSLNAPERDNFQAAIRNMSYPSIFDQLGLRTSNVLSRQDLGNNLAGSQSLSSSVVSRRRPAANDESKTNFRNDSHNIPEEMKIGGDRIERRPNKR